MNLRDKTVIVTGASSGIGAAAAREFARLGANVVVVGRSATRTVAVAEDIGGTAHTADFARLDDVRELATTVLATYPRIDVLANNAGGMFPQRLLTSDGNELTFQVNYLAPFLLTTLLLDRLTATPGTRVVNTASAAHKRGRLDLADLDFATRDYGWMKAYGAAKIGTILFTSELAARTKGTGLTASAFHPGAVAVEIRRDNSFISKMMTSTLTKMLALTAEQGAEPLIRLATIDDPEPANGRYFNRLKHEEVTKQAADPELATRLWDLSEKLTAAPVH